MEYFYSFGGSSAAGWSIFSKGVSREEIHVDISDIHDNMEYVTIEGRIVNFDRHMMVIDDESGRTFVRYNRRGRTREAWRNMLEQIRIGNRVRIQGCYSVNYSGIIQLKMTSETQITTLQLEDMER